MVIGIDIDDTMTNHCEVWFDLFNRKYKPDNMEPLQLADAYKWNFYDEYPDEIKQKLFDAMDDAAYFENIKLLDGVEKIINSLVEAGHQILIISSTTKKYQENKRNWLLKHFNFLKEEDIIFTTQKQLINVDVMIDDNLAYASKFKCPFILFKRPWNTNRESNLYTENLLICSTWDEIKEYFISQNVLDKEVVDPETLYSQATIDLIENIKKAKDNKECIEILNPYIKLWQEQGILIGIGRISEFLGKFAQDVDDDINKT